MTASNLPPRFSAQSTDVSWHGFEMDSGAALTANSIFDSAAAVPPHMTATGSAPDARVPTPPMDLSNSHNMGWGFQNLTRSKIAVHRSQT